MILFVGDRPSPKMKPGAKPFEGADCEKRLIDWQRIVAPDYFPPLTKEERDKGYICILGLFTYNSHTSEDLNDIETIARGRTAVIALGNVASKKLNGLNIYHFKLPHPSGRNRQINDKAFINSKLTECKKYIEKCLSSDNNGR